MSKLSLPCSRDADDVDVHDVISWANAKLVNRPQCLESPTRFQDFVRLKSVLEPKIELGDGEGKITWARDVLTMRERWGVAVNMIIFASSSPDSSTIFLLLQWTESTEYSAPTDNGSVRCHAVWSTKTQLSGKIEWAATHLLKSCGVNTTERELSNSISDIWFSKYELQQPSYFTGEIDVRDQFSLSMEVFPSTLNHNGILFSLGTRPNFEYYEWKTAAVSTQFIVIEFIFSAVSSWCKHLQ